jgi:hypothetical protein
VYGRWVMMKALKEFLQRCRGRHDMNAIDRRLLAEILESMAQRIDQLEKDIDPHRQRD